MNKFPVESTLSSCSLCHLLNCAKSTTAELAVTMAHDVETISRWIGAILMYKLQHLEYFSQHFNTCGRKTCLYQLNSLFQVFFPINKSLYQIKNLSCFQLQTPSTLTSKKANREFDRVGCLFPLKLLLRIQITCGQVQLMSMLDFQTVETA